MLLLLFFFFKQKTAYEMRISDWSSDVCSSDLWKSVRTGPLEQIDDDHFGPPLAPPENPAVRYTAGYTQDPKTAGGYTMNWDKFDEGTVQPRWLPRSPAVLQERMGTIDLDPAASDEGLWWLPRALMVEATPELEALFPVGTVMPSVITEAPFDGDREIGRAHV